MNENKKQIGVDLLIVVVVSLIVLVVYNMFNPSISAFVKDTSVNIVLRVLFVGGLFQFGNAGLGITIVALLRKENFLNYGLTKKNLLITILLSACCCVPDFIYNLIAGNVHAWLPFSDVNTTYEVLRSGFPWNVLGMLITAICWGFFEGFNYVVIAEKLSKCLPSKSKFWDWGAFICAVMCILIHGLVGVTPNAITEMICTMILIYGMLIVRKQTGNAWGCVLIFILYWNAL